MIRAGKIDVGRIEQADRVATGSAVDGRLGAAIGDDVVSATRRNDVGPAAAIDSIVSTAGDERVGRG